MLGQVTSVAGSLYLIRVLTNYLGPSEYGHLAIVLTMMGLINLVAIGSVSAGITRYYSIAAEQNDLPAYFTDSINFLRNAIIIVCFLGLIILITLYAFNYKQLLILGCSAILLSIITGIFTTINSIQNAARQRLIVAFHTGIEPWLRIVLCVVLIKFCGNSVIAVMFGYLTTSIILTLSQIFFLKYKLNFSIVKSVDTGRWIKPMLNYSWPFVVWGGVGWVQQSSARWALQMYGSSREVGLFSVVFQLGYTPIILATGLLTTLLLPIIFTRVGDAKDRSRVDDVKSLINKVTLITTIIVIISFIGSVVLHKFIFKLLVNSRYISISYLMPFAVLSGGLFSIAQIIASKMMALNLTHRLSYASIGSSILGILFSFLGAKYFSLHGVVIGSILHSISYLVLVIVTFPRNFEATTC